MDTAGSSLLLDVNDKIISRLKMESEPGQKAKEKPKMVGI